MAGCRRLSFRRSGAQLCVATFEAGSTYVAEPRRRVRVVRSMAREQPDGSPFRADMKAVGRSGTGSRRSPGLQAVPYLSSLGRPRAVRRHSSVTVDNKP